MNHIQAIKERLDILEHHIEERHKQAAHERKQLLHHLEAVRRNLEKMRWQHD
jgi:hypothetical protein